LHGVHVPTGHSIPRGHPKIKLLSALIQRDATDYKITPKSEGFHSDEHGQFICSRCDIITAIIDELMPAHEGGRVQ
jgi:hypothetical protein